MGNFSFSIFSLSRLELRLLAPVKPDDVGQKLDLLGGELPVGAVNLPEDVPGVEEQHLVLAVVSALPLSKNQSVQGSVTV